MKKKMILLVTLVFIFLYGAVVHAEDFSISKTKITINVGETVDLDISGTDKAAVWTSYNQNIAKVNQKGEVTALKTGKTTIKVRAGLKCKTCQVTVVNTSIKINKTSVVLYSGGNPTGTIQLKATVKGTTKNVKWESDDTSIATVDNNGKVSAVSLGKAVITATANGVSAQCNVIVSNDITSNTVEPSMNIVEDTIYLKTKGNDKTYTVARAVAGSSAKISWTTSNKNVAVVSNGKITAKKAGTAIITATANGKSDTVNVIVEDFMPSIKLNQNQCTLYTKKGNTATLKATVGGNSKTVDWKSSDTSIVTVNKGKLTAVSAGTAVVEATANGVTAACNVTVLETEVDLSSTQLNITFGESANILADVTGVSSSVKWASSVSKVATVKNGVITAKKAGETDIKATANGVTSVCRLIVTDKCNHQYDDGVPRKQSTCVSIGSVVYTCVFCGSNYNEPTNIVAHQYKDTVVKPTCEEAGYTQHTCAICGDSYCDSETSPLGHKMVESSVSQPTCITLGSIVSICDVCGKSETEEISMTEHSYGNWNVVKEATTTTEGKRQRICITCGHTDEEKIPVLPKDHVHKYKTVVQEAACDKDGYVEYTCSCGDNYREVTLATGHKRSDWKVVTTAKCNRKGKEEVVCEICKEILETREIPLAEHVEGPWFTRKEATCAENGEKVQVCSVCKEDINVEVIPTTKHKKGKWTVVSEASCGKTGLEKIACTTCGITIDTRTIAAKEHLYVISYARAADCTNDGIEIKTCTYCGDNQQNKVVPALGHDAEWRTSLYATCINGGSEYKMCNRCGEIVDNRTTSALGHDLAAGETTAPTCAVSGYTEYKCTRCDVTEKRDVTDKLEHQASEWHTIREANCVSGEVQGIVCTLCGETLESETLEEFGDHCDEVYSVIEPTPCSRGWTNYRCKFCRRTTIDNYVPATGSGKHVWDFDSYYMQSENYYLVPCKNCNGKKVYKTVEEIEKDKQAALDDEKAVAKVTEVIKQIITDDMTDAEKIYYVNDWICRNCEYDKETYNWVMQNGGLLFSCDATNTRGVMLHGKAVCSGYAKAFKEFMDQLDIDCRIVSSSRMNHDWNQVKLDDGWYWLDVTWNDDKNTNGFFFTKYFLLTSKRVFNYQIVTDETGGEECTGTKYLKGGAMFDKYFVESQEDINNMYLQQKDNLEIFIKCDDKRDTNGNTALIFLFRELSNEYESLFDEKLTASSVGLYDETGVICFENTEKLKQFFENRIAASETKTEEVDNAMNDEETTSDENVEEVADTEESEGTEEIFEETETDAMEETEETTEFSGEIVEETGTETTEISEIIEVEKNAEEISN